MKPLGDAFIRVISMIITLVIFCTIVTGIAGMGDLKKVGRVGGKALLYFEVVSTIALFMGLDSRQPGSDRSGVQCQSRDSGRQGCDQLCGPGQGANCRGFPDAYHPYHGG